jgi:hypothetical protein
MTKLHDLRGRLVALAAEQEAVNEQIAAHPDTLRKYLGRFGGTPAADAVIARVTYIRAESGDIQTRKDPIPWFGYNFRIADDPTTYQMRHASNGWSADFNDFGERGIATTRKSLSLFADMTGALVDGADGDQCLTPEMLAEVCKLPTPEAVAHLLRVVIGI